MAGSRVELIGGRYRVLRTLGAGGMGEVFEAVDEALERRVAVKVIRSAFAGPELQQRFNREARLLARIAHPNIVAVHDMGVDEDVPYLVMELLEGVDLRVLLAQRGKLPPDTVREIAAGMCGGLRAAHRSGVLHRDVKPSNVHLTRTGRVVLQDFGIAHLLDSSDTNLTMTGAVVGTPAYLPPEMVLGANVGPHSDMYALGVCMYEMLVGSQPFASERGGVHALMYRVVNMKAESLLGRPDIPADLADLVDRLLAKDPADRPDPEEALARLDSPAGAQQLVADLVTGDVRGRAVEAFRASEATTTGVTFNPPEGAAGRAGVPDVERTETVVRPGSAADVALSAITRQSILRAMSPQAAEARQREAVQLVARGSLEEAVELLSGLSEVWHSLFGPDHPSAVACEFWQGVCLARLGAGGESVAKFSSVAASTRRALTHQPLARLE